MDQPMKAIATPQWMLDFFKAVDTLNTDPATGYPSFFAADVDAAFGPQVLKGVDAVTKFLIVLDQPFLTKHNVTSVEQIDNCLVVLCSADMLKKGDAPDKRFHIVPLIDVFWLNEQGKINRWVVTFPKGAEGSANAGAFQ